MKSMKARSILLFQTEAVAKTYTLYDPMSSPSMSAMAFNPSITLINHKLCASMYEALTSWFMGENVHPSAFGYPGAWESMGEEYQEYWTQVASCRDIKVLK